MQILSQGLSTAPLLALAAKRILTPARCALRTGSESKVLYRKVSAPSTGSKITRRANYKKGEAGCGECVNHAFGCRFDDKNRGSFTALSLCNYRPQGREGRTTGGFSKQDGDLL